MTPAAPLRGITLRQPWVWAVLFAGKDLENRDKRTSVRGTFVIHTAKECPAAYYEDAVKWMVSRGLARSERWPALRPVDLPPDWDTLPVIPDREDLAETLGKLAGVADLQVVYDKAVAADSPTLRWKMDGKFAYRLANVKPCTPVDFRGMPGWFFVPASLVKGIESK